MLMKSYHCFMIPGMVFGQSQFPRLFQNSSNLLGAALQHNDPRATAFHSVQYRFKIHGVYIFVGFFYGWYAEIFCGCQSDVVFFQVIHKVLNTFPCCKSESLNCILNRQRDHTELLIDNKIISSRSLQQNR